MSNWVDFKKLRESLDFAAVLDHYQVDYKRKGTQAQAFCPLPNHQGSRNSPSFSASFEKRIWQCFGCGAKGNVLDFIALMEGLDPHDAGEFRQAALLAQERFGGQTANQPAVRQQPAPLPHRQPPSRAVAAPSSPKQFPAVVNPPLDFELKNLDTKSAYLRNRGFAERTIAHFGLGYCSKGLFAGRVVIPLHDPQGRLIGYAGRLIYDDAVDAENPKYLFPSKREREGRIHEFAKSIFLYNGHRLTEPVNDLIVVEGFPATWWLWQHGHRNVVALMGSSCSVDQANLITRLVDADGRVWLFPDLDDAGIRCAQSLLMQISPHRSCRWVKPTAGPQPTDCAADDLAALLPKSKV